MNENLGSTTALEIFQSLGALIKKSLGAFGFSTRHGRHQMVTVLPHEDIKEAEQLLEDFARELQEGKIHRIQVNSSSEEQKDQLAIVEMKIKKGIKIYGDAIASIKTSGLIGISR